MAIQRNERATKKEHSMIKRCVGSWWKRTETNLPLYWLWFFLRRWWRQWRFSFVDRNDTLTHSLIPGSIHRPPRHQKRVRASWHWSVRLYHVVLKRFEWIKKQSQLPPFVTKWDTTVGASLRVTFCVSLGQLGKNDKQAIKFVNRVVESAYAILQYSIVRIRWIEPLWKHGLVRVLSLTQPKKRLSARQIQELLRNALKGIYEKM